MPIHQRKDDLSKNKKGTASQQAVLAPYLGVLSVVAPSSISIHIDCVVNLPFSTAKTVKDLLKFCGQNLAMQKKSHFTPSQLSTRCFVKGSAASSNTQVKIARGKLRPQTSSASRPSGLPLYCARKLSTWHFSVSPQRDIFVQEGKLKPGR